MITVMSVKEMCCPVEGRAVEKALRAMEGVEDILFDYAARTVRVTHGTVAVEALVRELEKLGMTACVSEAAKSEAPAISIRVPEMDCPVEAAQIEQAFAAAGLPKAPFDTERRVVRVAASFEAAKAAIESCGYRAELLREPSGRIVFKVPDTDCPVEVAEIHKALNKCGIEGAECYTECRTVTIAGDEATAEAVKAAIEKELSGLLARRQNRGMAGAKTQVMLCGIPNVGKSTFINTFAGSARAKAADRPGVTKGKQWVSTEKFDLLDMPGVLWKKFDSKTIASNLAFIGSIKDDILDVEELAMNLLDEVRRNYPDLVAQRYKLDAETLALPPYELMEAIGRKRGLLVRGGEVNTERCAVMLVDEFRACKWGRISLERPPQRDDMADFAEEDEE